jgi:hypothetical protein
MAHLKKLGLFQLEDQEISKNAFKKKIIFSFLVTFTTDYMTNYEGFKMVFYTKGNSTKPPTTTTPTTTGNHSFSVILIFNTVFE